MTYQPLFLLEAGPAFIFEIKRLDVQSDNPGDVYFWLYFDKVRHTLQPLTFVSMSNDGDEQQRTFAQGRLRFAATAGTYEPLPAAPPLPLRRLNPPTLPAAVETAVHTLFGAAGAGR